MRVRCRDVAERATEHTEGSLGWWTASRVRRHLASCPDCRAYIAGLALTSRALRTLATTTAQPSAEQRSTSLATFRAFHASSSEANARKPFPAQLYGGAG